MKWAPIQACVYLARPMRRCSVIGLSSGIYSQDGFSHCPEKDWMSPSWQSLWPYWEVQGTLLAVGYSLIGIPFIFNFSDWIWECGKVCIKKKIQINVNVLFQETRAGDGRLCLTDLPKPPVRFIFSLFFQVEKYIYLTLLQMLQFCIIAEGFFHTLGDKTTTVLWKPFFSMVSISAGRGDVKYVHTSHLSIHLLLLILFRVHWGAGA